MTSNLPPELQGSAFQAAVVSALARTYEENQDRHDPGIGHDAITFGSALWRSSVFFMRRSLAEVSGVSTAEVNQSLSILAGRCRLRVHKLGTSELDNPETSFPNSVGPASRMGGGDRQRELDLGEPAVTEYLDWVLGHYGSADDGLRAVRLQAVGSERALDGKIARWESIETIFDVRTRVATSPTQPARPDDVVIVQDPPVSLRVAKREDSKVNAT